MGGELLVEIGDVVEMLWEYAVSGFVVNLDCGNVHVAPIGLKADKPMLIYPLANLIWRLKL